MTTIFLVVAIVCVVLYMRKRHNKKLEAMYWPTRTGHNEQDRRKSYDRHGRPHCKGCGKHHHGDCA